MRLMAFLILCRIVVDPAIAAASDSSYTPGEVILKFQDAHAKLADVPKWQTLNQRYNMTALEPIFPTTSSGISKPVRAYAWEGIYLLHIDDRADVAEAAAAYAQLPGIVYAQPNGLYQHCSAPNDPRYDEQWALHTLEAAGAWEKLGISEQHVLDPVLIAIVDSGVDYDHEDLQGRCWINKDEQDGIAGVDDDGNGYVDDVQGWDFSDAPTLPGSGDYTERDNDPMDESGHGTHVAGIVGACVDNHKGIAGVCPPCRLMMLRAGFNMGNSGFLQDDDVAAAIVYAVDNGAKIINISWGDRHFSSLMQDVIRYAYEAGCILVAAAGNESDEALYYPAAFEETISVSATTQRDGLASFSNFGGNLDVAAPGNAILSTWPGNEYRILSGTSMAAPHAVGVVGLLCAYHPEFSADQIRTLILASVEDLSPPGWDPYFGAGRINARRALTAETRLTVQLLSPATASGLHSGTAILGTIIGESIERYELSFAPGEHPEDWTLLLTSDAAMTFEDTLALWDTSTLPDSLYTLRLEAFRQHGQTIEDRVVVTVDHTPPQVDSLRILNRLNGASYHTFLSWTTDDITSAQISIQPDSEVPLRFLAVQNWDTKHLIDLEQYLDAGSYGITVIAENLAGLTVRTDTVCVSIQEDVIDRRGYEEVDALPEGILLNTLTDFDQDGRREIVWMTRDTAPYGKVTVYESQTGGALAPVFTSATPFLPWNVGDTDGDGIVELIGVHAAQLWVFEGANRTAFPDTKIWEFKDVWGGRIADLDGDGVPEIVARSDRAPEWVLFDSPRDNTFERIDVLPNPTQGENLLCARPVIADFDGDGAVEIISGDSDGDLFGYERISNGGFRVSFILEGNGDARYLTGGTDLDGDGRLEFVVCTMFADLYNPAAEHWSVTVYQCAGDDHYAEEWRTEICGIQPNAKGQGVTIGDADGDGIDEWAICTPPDVYLFDSYGPDRYQPVWYLSAADARVPVIGDLDGDGLPEFLCNKDGMVRIYEHQPDGDYRLVPFGVAAVPMDSISVRLTWSSHGEGPYGIYRAMDRSQLKLWKIADASPYLDRELITDTPYFYGITTVLSEAPFRQTPLSQVVEVTPGRPPELMSAYAASLYRVIVRFSEPMGRSAEMPSHYHIADVGFARSAVLDQGSQRVTLTFRAPFEPEHPYTLSVTHVKARSGIPVPEPAGTIGFVGPEKPSRTTRLISARALSSLQVEVVFTRPVDLASAQPDAFRITWGGADTELVIINVIPTDARILRLSLHEATPVLSLGKPYRLRTSGLLDIEGQPVLGEVTFKMSEPTLKHVTVFPNPFQADGNAKMTFGRLTTQATVTIYALDGVMVRRLYEDEGDGGVEWDGRNEEGRLVGSGIYFYVAAHGSERHKGKVAVVR